MKFRSLHPYSCVCLAGLSILFLMNKVLLLLLSVVFICCVGLAQAAAPKAYQVTGPVLEVSDSTIIVEKNKERWEISRDAATKVVGDLKVGSKVTIFYRMLATDVDVKACTAPPAPAATAP